ncbi:MAG TPA: MoaD/ThiS family protein [Acetobacteraceae bacterium]|jgi:molybdopterin converting factor small subunit
MITVAVRVAALLHNYTRGESDMRASGATLGEVLDDLDHRFPGIRFRVVDEQDQVRRHVRCFVNDTDARDVAARMHDGDEIYIVGALSGG